MSTQFFTNEAENTLMKKFESIIKYNTSINCFDALVGYLRASGYFNLRPHLKDMQRVRILIGINVDKFLIDALNRGILVYGADEEQAKYEYIEGLKADIENAEYTQNAENSINAFFNDIIDKKIEIRAHPSKKIHAKLYIFYPFNFNESTPISVITGSSNLTGNGLGIHNNNQYEFNVELRNYDDFVFAKNEFEKLWEEAKDYQIATEDILKAKKQTYLDENPTPYEIYVKMLIEYFGDRIYYDADDIITMPTNFKRMEYQVEAVSEAFAKLLKHNGVFLADVVGLGKTIIATMIAYRFSAINGNKNTKILVVYPPALKENWTTTFSRFGLSNAQFISNGMLDQIIASDNKYWKVEEYDLVIVDESHKFRNHETKMFRALQEICKCPRINKGKIAGLRKKIILISATPLNNRPQDIYNQILLFQDPRRCTLDGLTNLTAFFSPKIEEYKKLLRNAEENKTEIRNKINKLYGDIREKVIKPLMVRRTRRDIESIERYSKDVKEFPKVQRPKKVEYKLDDTLSALFDYTVDKLIDKRDGLKYARYQAIAALRPDIQILYYEQAERASHSLAYIMKTLLVKRLESSFFAFRQSIHNFAKANRHMIEMMKNNKVFIAPDLDIEKFYDSGMDEDEIMEEVEKASAENPKNRVFKASDFDDNFLTELIEDQEILDELCDKWDANSEDPKLNRFLEMMRDEFFDKNINHSGKLVIFSESVDTVKYLKDHISRKDVIVVSAKNRSTAFDKILSNFDANYEGEQENQYNILLTTDALAEGINLHRSHIIVHYDTPWNATKLMQRIGRVNRIGSKFDKIYNYVFYPSAQGNQQIGLIKNSLIKIQAFHSALGEDSQIYSQDEIIDINLDRLFDEGLPEEETNRELKYLEFIRDLKQKCPKEFQRIDAIPIRSRTGRTSYNMDNIRISNSTLVFIKTGEKYSFYLADDDKATELSALEAMDIFSAKKEEKCIELIDKHYLHVNKALTMFKQDRERAYQYAPPQANGVQVENARRLITNYMNDCSDNPDRIQMLDILMKLVEAGTITSIATGICKLEKQLRRHEITKVYTLTELLNMADKYKNYYIEENCEKKEPDPTIILSESFGTLA